MDLHGHGAVVLVTGGAGFIGGALIRHLLANTGFRIVNLDKLTYAANPAALAELDKNENYKFVMTDIADGRTVQGIFSQYHPDALLHLAAESHVDRSIDTPSDFILTNIVGTATLLEAAREYLASLPKERADNFRFHHISTDEVFGSLSAQGKFNESTPYAPASPYSASKASSDHLVRAWHATYGVPVLLSNCSNNYGPWQFPEKLIPLMILKALNFEPLPVYGKGDQIRDWLHVEDHARALRCILTRGRVGETYMVGGDCERRNLEVVETICDLVDSMAPSDLGPRRNLIHFVQDRPGHDARYAIDATKIQRDLGWTPQVDFASGLAATVRWYLDRRDIWKAQTSYRGERLGTLTGAVA